jgi:hypothetical protein
MSSYRNFNAPVYFTVTDCISDRPEDFSYIEVWMWMELVHWLVIWGSETGKYSDYSLMPCSVVDTTVTEEAAALFLSRRWSWHWYLSTRLHGVALSSLFLDYSAKLIQSHEFIGDWLFTTAHQCPFMWDTCIQYTTSHYISLRCTLTLSSHLWLWPSGNFLPCGFPL